MARPLTRISAVDQWKSCCPPVVWKLNGEASASELSWLLMFVYDPIAVNVVVSEIFHLNVADVPTRRIADVGLSARPLAGSSYVAYVV